MSESGEKLSLIDLIEYYEPGPVLRERTPDLNRTSFYPDEAQHFESDEAPEPGKNITRKAELDLIRKKALGLTDIPIHGTPGNTGAFRQRDEYSEEEDFEAQFTTGFGGPSELNNFLDIEDKPPTNITRKLKVKFNPDKKEELDKMSFQKSELLKLAKALRHRGQSHFANKVEGIALRKVASLLSPAKKQQFMSTWGKDDAGANKDWVIGKVRLDKNQAFVDSCYGEADVGGLTGAGTQEGLMLAALFADPDEQEVKKLFKEQGGLSGELRGSYGFGKKYSESTIEEVVRSELGGAYLEAAEAIMNGTVNAQNFEPESGSFKEASKAISGSQPRTPAQPPATPKDDKSTTQQRTWKDIQIKLNELFDGDGVLAGNVQDGKIRGTNVKIPLTVDDPKIGRKALGPQTTGAFNAATGENYEEENWLVNPDKAYTMLLEVERGTKEGEVAKGGEDADKPAEGTTEEVDKTTILSGARLNFVDNPDEWYTASADDGKTLVAIRKRDGQLAAMRKEKYVAKNKDGRNTLKQSEDGQRVWTDMENRGESDQVLFSAGDDYMSRGEIRRLMKVIEDAGVDKEQRKEYEDVMKGQKRSERGGFLNQRGAKRRGKRRQTGAEERLRGRARARRNK